jgi:hypothetical protein
MLGAASKVGVKSHFRPERPVCEIERRRRPNGAVPEYVARTPPGRRPGRSNWLRFAKRGPAFFFFRPVHKLPADLSWTRAVNPGGQQAKRLDRQE